MGEDEWNKLSDQEKQRKIVELKMKEKKLREEGKTNEAAALFDKLMDNDEGTVNHLLFVCFYFLKTTNLDIFMRLCSYDSSQLILILSLENIGKDFKTFLSP